MHLRAFETQPRVLRSTRLPLRSYFAPSTVACGPAMARESLHPRTRLVKVELAVPWRSAAMYTGQTSTSPRSRTTALTMASTPQMAATTPPLSSCAPIPPDPAVLERGPIGIDGPAAHLHARVHVPVEHEAAAAPRGRCGSPH